MKKYFYLLFLFLNLSLYAQVEIKADYEKARNHVYILASDSMQGRKTGEKGQKMAAEYIANHFKEYNINGINSDSCINQYYQEFALFKNFAFIKMPSRDKSLTIHKVLKNDFLAFGNFNKKSLTNSTLVSHDEFGNCTDTSAFLLISADHLAEGLRQMHVRNIKCGNKKFFIQIPDKEFSEISKSYPEGSYFLHNENDSYTYSRFYDSTPDTNLNTDKIQFLFDIKNYAPEIKLIIVSSNFFNENHISNHFSTNYKIPASNIDFTLNQPNFFDTLFTENVVGYIKGKTNPSEVVVIGAHYDHVGYNETGIFYGADDNASGTAALIEIARMYSENIKLGNYPEQTVYFIAFTAEEMGLLGSEYFVQNPVFNLDSCKIMINMDMIGRPIRSTNNNYHVYYLLSGKNKAKTHRNLRSLKKGIPKFDLVRNPGLIQKVLYNSGSDHYRFSKRGIKTIVFFTDKHNDYHKITDTPEKIDFKNLEAIINLVFKYSFFEATQ